MPVVIVLTSCSDPDRPSTTPNTTSPRTMIVNSPKRSTNDSVGRRPRLRPTAGCRRASRPPIQPSATHVHTTSRGPSARKALANTTPADTPMPMT